MTAKEKPTAREYPNDAMTARVKRALKSGRKMRIDVDGRSVDVKIGELIGPRSCDRAAIDRGAGSGCAS